YRRRRHEANCRLPTMELTMDARRSTRVDLQRLDTGPGSGLGLKISNIPRRNTVWKEFGPGDSGSGICDEGCRIWREHVFLLWLIFDKFPLHGQRLSENVYGT